MVTSGFCQTRLRVRFPAPHPFFFLLLLFFFLLLAGSSSAAEPDSSDDAQQSLDVPVAYALSDRVFGLIYSDRNIGDYRIANLSDDTKVLAAALKQVFLEAESRVQAVEASAVTAVDLEEYLGVSSYLYKLVNKIYVGTDEVEGTLKNIYSVANANLPKLQDLLTSLDSLSSYLSQTSYSLSYYSIDRVTGKLTNATVNYVGLLNLLRLGYRSLTWSIASGFDVLNNYLAGADRAVTFNALSFDDAGNPVLTPVEMKDANLFDLIAYAVDSIQNPLAKLQYMLADDGDIALKAANKEASDSFRENFSGDGGGSVGAGQIKDVAGISSSVKDSFAGAGSPGDAFTAINDSQSFWFFSQEVADALDAVNAPVLASEEDDFMDQFVRDEDGFYSLIDLSPWDVGSYLGG